MTSLLTIPHGRHGHERSARVSGTFPRCSSSSANLEPAVTPSRPGSSITTPVIWRTGRGFAPQPRALLHQIPGIWLVTPAEAEICCGSAGIYNLVQPEPAAEIGARKAANIAAVAPDLIATANPGCILQIAAAGRQLGHHWPIFHPVQLIDASIRGVDPRAG